MKLRGPLALLSLTTLSVAIGLHAAAQPGAAEAAGDVAFMILAAAALLPRRLF